ncbi:hypothetical protein [uncultured Thiohalocapsa sp.]|uniref:hypothetical protein n=1 Tax=uncultured Thiohalocapsa sp. TaxID=768990 RepID=UPI0025EF76A5|nr:hypothetical protein [uncultured Thiohalocapsa sp.]
MGDCYASCIGRLIQQALPEADPARIDMERLKYLCDAPQERIDWITTNAADDIQTLARGLALLNTLAADAPPQGEDIRALADTNTLLAELIEQLSLLVERATCMTGKEGDE